MQKNSPTIVTQRMIWDELQALKRQMNDLTKPRKEGRAYDLEEVSLYKACKLLHLGSDTVIGFIKGGELKARLHKSRSGGVSYRLRLSDIQEWQEQQAAAIERWRRDTEEQKAEVESMEDIFLACRKEIVGV